ncbi:hypothetical protein Nepgr_012394 [Nepenthes gracilis]|uniref:Uncharacterized protein n=1 Tax=Nepenthes gracilis TaxID=150966 RepID=A0AAD3SFX4_NEPGR|nr:hypothetical protein Nepgr_012394 [Nepenthes gracilis]
MVMFVPFLVPWWVGDIVPVGIRVLIALGTYSSQPDHRCTANFPSILVLGPPEGLVETIMMNPATIMLNCGSVFYSVAHASIEVAGLTLILGLTVLQWSQQPCLSSKICIGMFSRLSSSKVRLYGGVQWQPVLELLLSPCGLAMNLCCGVAWCE